MLNPRSTSRRVPEECDDVNAMTWDKAADKADLDTVDEALRQSASTFRSPRMFDTDDTDAISRLNAEHKQRPKNGGAAAKQRSCVGLIQSFRKRNRPGPLHP